MPTPKCVWCFKFLNIQAVVEIYSSDQRQIQDFPKGGAWVVAGMDISYLDFL